MTDAALTLPAGWGWSTLGELCHPSQYGWTTKAAESGSVRFLRTTDITHGPIEWSTVPFCAAPPEDLDRYRLKTGDIVISRAGSVGFSAVIEGPPPDEAVFASYLIRFRPREARMARYLAWYLQSPAYWQAIGVHAVGIALANVNAKKLSAIPVPVPPADEQDLLVAFLDTLSSRIESGRRSLRAAQSRLSQYRASVLEQELAGNGSWPMREPASLVRDTPNALAIGPFGSNLKVVDYRDEGVPLVFVRNIREARFDGPNTRYVDVTKAEELSSHRVEPGDVLITKMGDPPGDASVYPQGAHQAIITADCIRFAVDDAEVMSQYAALLFETWAVRQQIRERVKGVAQQKISLKTFRELRLPIPPREQQDWILHRVERQLQAQTALAENLESALHDAKALSRSALHLAFFGRLSVRRDPFTAQLDKSNRPESSEGVREKVGTAASQW